VSRIAGTISSQTEPNRFPNRLTGEQASQAIAKVSKATATRRLADLLAKGCLVRLAGGGRSTRYRANIDGEDTKVSIDT
jgi:Fic family protein